MAHCATENCHVQPSPTLGFGVWRKDCHSRHPLLHCNVAWKMMVTERSAAKESSIRSTPVIHGPHPPAAKASPAPPAPCSMRQFDLVNHLVPSRLALAESRLVLLADCPMCFQPSVPTRDLLYSKGTDAAKFAPGIKYSQIEHPLVKR